MISAFPKIFALGEKYIIDIFNEEVEITEKVDGSQFTFGKIDGQLYTRSKNAQIFPENCDKMWTAAIEYIDKVERKIPDNMSFYCEYLRKPKHNCLCYSRVPKNNLMLFGISSRDKTFYPGLEIRHYAGRLGIEPVPVLYTGKISSMEELNEYLEYDSFLGGTKIEGVVVKNYNRTALIGGKDFPIMCGKYVSGQFKEKNMKNWKKTQGKGRWEEFKQQYRTEARWIKAIQHLQEAGKLEESPRDIGSLLKEIHTDIETEEKEGIKEELYKFYRKDILRTATAGFPEWYKQELAKKSFGEEAVNKFDLPEGIVVKR